MFAQFAVVACLVGLVRSGNLQNSAQNYGGYPGNAAFSGYAGGFSGYAGSYPGHSVRYPGYGSNLRSNLGLNAGVATSYSNFNKYTASTGYDRSYPGYGSNIGSNLGLSSGVATSYNNFNKYTSPGSYNTGYDGVTGSYTGLNRGVLNNWPYAGLNGAGGNGLPYSDLSGTGLIGTAINRLPYAGAANINGVGFNGLYGGLRGSVGVYDGVSYGGYGSYGYGGNGANGGQNAW